MNEELNKKIESRLNKLFMAGYMQDHVPENMKRKKEGNMDRFIYGPTRGSGRFVGSKKKHKITGKKKR